MKYVIMLLSEASKIDFSGSEKLTKSDILEIIYVKGKKTISDAVKEKLDSIKATITYTEVAAAGDVWLYVAYQLGKESATKHDVYLISKDKSKIPSKVLGDAHAYVSFKSLGSSSTSKSTTAKKTTTTKKTTSKSKKKEETSVIDVVASYMSGDSKKAQEGLVDFAEQFLGTKK